MQDYAGEAFGRCAGRLWMVGCLAAATLIWTSPALAQVEFQSTPDHIAVAIDGKPFTDFYIGSEYPKPFLHPLRAADGRVVTRQFPMSQVEGETRDHPHHRGLFIGYGSISGINFWENEQAYTTPNRGRIVLVGRPRLENKKDIGAIRAEFSWRDPAGKEMLTESRLMEFRGGATSRTIDFTIELTAKRDLHFDDTKEGFFAIRVADSMRETAGGQLLNSLGSRGEKQIWGKRADWAEYSGNVDGKPVAILIFDHPSSYNHPPRWHARAYGLFAVNPFGLKDFEPASTETGGASLKSGEKLKFRYRVLISGAPLTMTEAEQIYREFASSQPQRPANAGEQSSSGRPFASAGQPAKYDNRYACASKKGEGPCFWPMAGVHRQRGTHYDEYDLYRQVVVEYIQATERYGDHQRLRCGLDWSVRVNRAEHCDPEYGQCRSNETAHPEFPRVSNLNRRPPSAPKEKPPEVSRRAPRASSASCLPSASRAVSSCA